MNKSNWSIDQKLSIVLEGLRDGVQVVELCRKYGVSQSKVNIIGGEIYF